MPVQLAAARQISPLIRFARWSALLAGIAYGASRFKYLSKREVAIQKEENEIRERYNKKRDQITQQKMAEEMNALGKEAGVVPK